MVDNMDGTGHLLVLLLLDYLIDYFGVDLNCLVVVSI